MDDGTHWTYTGTIEWEWYQAHPDESAPLTAAKPKMFRELDGTWRITLNDQNCALRGSLGMHYLHLLLENPNRAIACDQLREIAAHTPGAPDHAVTEEEIFEKLLKNEFSDLLVSAKGILHPEEDEDFDEDWDLFDRMTAKEAIELLQRNLAENEALAKQAYVKNRMETFKFHGREVQRIDKILKRFKDFQLRWEQYRSSNQQSRSAVTHAINFAIQKITQADSAIGRYFAAHIETGEYCTFRPNGKNGGGTARNTLL